ncbi:23S rRNA (guanosine2251-2'-O)-methyltransferase [Syntrophus gentianae]|uniref:23S rRNA (Guanosine2251-2'-O)-methyltransferase n=1 Tax=Syntrophus gentianae TaxID=43775 RepID=A0A1H7UTN6_9BACT|nr:23S rRNA (guanosine(2251)-2'-O)-methyltransferase RlmB [Syntrophus gentianae]SEM00342.1 23S rRNA (guanosine2251-2'-O)-methyltransferase [Syntrophus gentianae]
MEVIYGVNPLKEALISGGGGLTRIVIARGRSESAIREISTMAAKQGIPVEVRERAFLDELAETSSHQGVLGMCKPYRYQDLDAVIANRHPSCLHDLVLILDGITDPHNLGALLRTAHCFGVNGVLLPEHRSASVTATVIKTSAGAARYLPVARVANLARALDELKKRGFWIFGADAHATQSVSVPDYQGAVGLIMGAEGKGMRPLIRKQCDFLISIPMLGKIDSLNVSVSAGIVMHEIRRKTIWHNS